MLTTGLLLDTRVWRTTRAYLDAIDRLVTAEIPPGSRSLLDVGRGMALALGAFAAAVGLA